MGHLARHSPHSLHCCVRFPCDHVDAVGVLSCHGSPPFRLLSFSFAGKNADNTNLWRLDTENPTITRQFAGKFLAFYVFIAILLTQAITGLPHTGRCGLCPLAAGRGILPCSMSLGTVPSTPTSMPCTVLGSPSGFGLKCSRSSSTCWPIASASSPGRSCARRCGLTSSSA